MTRLPPPQPDEDTIDQRARVRDQRLAAPLVFGVVLGAAFGGAVLVALTALQIHHPAWLDSLVMYGCMLAVGPFTVYRYTRAHPNWVETGVTPGRGR